MIGNTPLIGLLAPDFEQAPRSQIASGLLAYKPPTWRTRLADNLIPNASAYSDDDKNAMVRQGLLHAGLAMLQARGGFGNAVGEGLQTGLLAMNQSADDMVNDRYRQAMMTRTIQGAERNARAEDLASRFWGPDNKPNMEVARELATIDAPMAKSLLEFGQPEQESWSPTQIPDPTNPNNELTVLHNGHGQFRFPDGTPVFAGDTSAVQADPQIAGGLLGDAIPQTPRFGIMDAVEQVESGGNPNAVSPKGAIGPMQTMPSTLMDPGFGVIPARDNSVAEQRRVGQDYLKVLTERYGVTGGLAAYNWGPGNWDRALASNNNDVSAALSTSPAETRAYVPKVMDLMGGNNPAPAAPAASRFSRPRYKPEGEGAGRSAPSGYQWAPDGQSLVPIPGGPADRKNNPTPSDLSKAEMAMRKEVTDRVEDSRQVMSMFQKVQAAAQQPSAANDLAMIFAYMKMLDPGSVVREQEFANAQNAAGVPDQVRNAYNKALRGERLNPEQRNQFLSSARQIADIAGQQITDVAREYQNTADEYGYDPRRATGFADFRGVQGSVSTSSGPEVGQVQDGYRFKGGNPSDPNSWEKL